MNAKTTLSLARWTFGETCRPSALAGLAIVVLVLAVIATFFSQLAIIESASFFTASYIAIARIAAMLLLAVTVATSVQREIDSGHLAFVLSRPVSRIDWYAGRSLGFFALAALLGFALSIPLLSATTAQVLQWALILSCELCIVAAASFAFVLTLRNVALTIAAVAAFYTLARSIEALVLMGAGPLAHEHGVWGVAVQWLAVLLPNLSAFAGSNILLQADSTGMVFVAVQTLVYAVLLTALGMIDCVRREL